MRTLEEYKEYCKQLEGDVKKWREAYEALKTLTNTERKKFLDKIKELKKK